MDLAHRIHVALTIPGPVETKLIKGLRLPSGSVVTPKAHVEAVVAEIERAIAEEGGRPGLIRTAGVALH